ncbi:hypothetical protein [uncultured Draconibacterium sp.]|uniref:hypothetical protein n=1 Tax=uncultured Draconibacterium sp. TaxID=1573823 RepID=UPI0025E010A8|nr:hypothetical protein [uncultured Draconibacterium sp.]
MKTRINLKAVALMIGVALAIGNVNATEKVTKASSHENIIETSLLLEDWMTSEAIWNTSDAIQFVDAQEEMLELENWMTNSEIWDVANVWSNLETEAGLELEEWMTNDVAWEVNNGPAYETEYEDNLSLENWMVNDTIWN